MHDVGTRWFCAAAVCVQVRYHEVLADVLDFITLVSRSMSCNGFPTWRACSLTTMMRSLSVPPLLRALPLLDWLPRTSSCCCGWVLPLLAGCLLAVPPLPLLCGNFAALLFAAVPLSLQRTRV